MTGPEGRSPRPTVTGQGSLALGPTVTGRGSATPGRTVMRQRSVGPRRLRRTRYRWLEQPMNKCSGIATVVKRLAMDAGRFVTVVKRLPTDAMRLLTVAERLVGMVVRMSLLRAMGCPRRALETTCPRRAPGTDSRWAPGTGSGWAPRTGSRRTAGATRPIRLGTLIGSSEGQMR